jgi:hypothetical protein
MEGQSMATFKRLEYRASFRTECVNVLQVLGEGLPLTLGPIVSDIGPQAAPNLVKPEGPQAPLTSCLAILASKLDFLPISLHMGAQSTALDGVHSKSQV